MTTIDLRTGPGSDGDGGGTAPHYDAVVVGAGFSGLYMLHKLRELGFTARVYEAGDGVGGTWYWNRYPGARCDSESYIYSYSFSPELEQEWEWSSKYPEQPEILRYLEHVADRFDLRRDIQLSTRVVGAAWDEGTGRWQVRTDRGEQVEATWFITAIGCLSSAQVPAIPGIESFAGDQYHTGRYPHDGVDFRGKRVGIIGTGSTGIQAIPVIAEQAEHLTVFQRTPNFSVPARNAPLAPEDLRAYKERYDEIRAASRTSTGGMPYQPSDTSALAVDEEERQRRYARAWEAGGFKFFIDSFNDIALDLEANATAAEFVRSKIRETVVDPEVAERLCPTDHPIGSKRPPIDTGYFETYNRPNVTLVDIRSTPIEEITPTGIRTAAGDHDLDIIVFATGFDAMTGAFAKIDITGRDGTALSERWAAGPYTYLGLAVAGFPNLFTITGPGSPSVLSNMPISIEQHVEWIADCLVHLRASGTATIEASPAAEAAWVDHVNEVAGMTLFPLANSWYLGANVPGKPRVFMPYAGGVGAYRKRCDEVAAAGYEGFVLTPATVRQPV